MFHILVIGQLESVSLNIDAQGQSSVLAYVLSVLVMDPYGRLVQVGGYDRKFNSENVMSVAWVDNWLQIGSANQNATRDVTQVNLHDYEGFGGDVTSDKQKRSLENIEMELVRTRNALRKTRSTLKGSKDGSHFSVEEKEKIAVSLKKQKASAGTKSRSETANQAYAECGIYYSYSYSSRIHFSHDYSYGDLPYPNCTATHPEYSPDGIVPSLL